MHLSVLIAYDFSEYIFIKIYNFLLGRGMESVGKNLPSFSSLPHTTVFLLQDCPLQRKKAEGMLWNSTD